MGISDYILLGISTIFLIIITLRVIVVIFSSYIISQIKKSATFESYDRLLFLYLSIYVAFSLIVNTTRPDFAVESVILGISIFAIYLALPTRFLNQTILSLAYTIGQVLLLGITIHGQSRVEFAPIVFVFIFANAIAAYASWEFNYYRWLVFRDLSELKKSERFVVIGQTAGMVGHDIRNPLQAIISDLYLIEQEIKDNPTCANKDITESINSINENIEYINKIVNDLQNYTTTIRPNLAMVNIKLIFDKLLMNIPKNVEKCLNVKEDLEICTDTLLLQRALTNLIINAVQAMPAGGRLTLEAEDSYDKVQIRVIDTGIGISAEAKPNLFKPLFTTKAKGQGLGLAVVKRLIDALGGTITFESEIGNGTVFIIDLPNNVS